MLTAFRCIFMFRVATGGVSRRISATARSSITGLLVMPLVGGYPSQPSDPAPVAGTAKLVSRWTQMVWLGKVAISDEHICGLKSDAHKVRSVRRVPEERRWDKTLLGAPLPPVGHGGC